MKSSGTIKRRRTKGPAKGSARKKASGPARKRKTSGPAGNRRRHPRAGAAAREGAAATGRHARASIAAPPRDGGGSPILRRLARLGIRVALAGGLAYGVLVGAREGYEYATTSPRFEVRGLLFQPSAHISDQRLRELMAIAPGTNILAVDLDAVASQVTADPWVAKASVTRILPDTLDVEVTEHKPVAVLLAGTFYLVNEEGLPFKPMETGERGQLPVVTGVVAQDLLLDPDGAKVRVQRALETLAAYELKRRPRLSEINVDDTGAVTLYTAELGSQLRLGRGDVTGALARYDALRAALGQESEKLAVAHLDASAAPEAHDRVVASFFPAAEVPGFVNEAEARTTAEAKRRKAAKEAAKEAKKKGKGALPGKKKSKLPKYE